jgi:hypothetical protein
MKNNQILLEKYFSKSRLKKYAETIKSNDVEKILETYRLNIKYSEKFYSALTQFEVFLRNAINEQLILDFGNNWYDKDKIISAPKQRELINSLKLDLINGLKPLNSCNIVSNLTFGFWVNLFNPEYDKTLWRKSLSTIFQHRGEIPERSLVRLRLMEFHKLRNRISHCELILQFPLDKYYIQLIDFVSWINQDLANWLEKEIEFDSIKKLKND